MKHELEKRQAARIERREGACCELKRSVDTCVLCCSNLSFVTKSMKGRPSPQCSLIQDYDDPGKDAAFGGSSGLRVPRSFAKLRGEAKARMRRH